MNRKLIVILILIGVFSIIGIGGYAYATSFAESDTPKSEITSEDSQKSELDVTDTEVESSDAQAESAVVTEDGLDENGVPVEQSTYLDDDGDTVANAYDVCPGYDDFLDENGNSVPDDCEDSTTESGAAIESDELDKNGDARSESKYLDDDGDTVANYYDVCPDVDDFSDECDTSSVSSVSSSGESDGSTTEELDKNGDTRSQSKYLDDDGDTVANYFDICPNGNDTVDKDGNGTPDDCD